MHYLAPLDYWAGLPASRVTPPPLDLAAVVPGLFLAVNPLSADLAPHPIAGRNGALRSILFGGFRFSPIELRVVAVPPYVFHCAARNDRKVVAIRVANS